MTTAIVKLGTPLVPGILASISPLLTEKNAQVKNLDKELPLPSNTLAQFRHVDATFTVTTKHVRQAHAPITAGPLPLSYISDLLAHDDHIRTELKKSAVEEADKAKTKAVEAATAEAKDAITALQEAEDAVKALQEAEDATIVIDDNITELKDLVKATATAKTEAEAADADADAETFASTHTALIKLVVALRLQGAYRNINDAKRVELDKNIRVLRKLGKFVKEQFEAQDRVFLQQFQTGVRPALAAHMTTLGQKMARGNASLTDVAQLLRAQEADYAKSYIIYPSHLAHLANVLQSAASLTEAAITKLIDDDIAPELAKAKEHAFLSQLFFDILVALIDNNQPGLRAAQASYTQVDTVWMISFQKIFDTQLSSLDDNGQLTIHTVWTLDNFWPLTPKLIAVVGIGVTEPQLLTNDKYGRGVLKQYRGYEKIVAKYKARVELYTMATAILNKLASRFARGERARQELRLFESYFAPLIKIAEDMEMKAKIQAILPVGPNEIQVSVAVSGLTCARCRQKWTAHSSINKHGECHWSQLQSPTASGPSPSFHRQVPPSLTTLPLPELVVHLDLDLDLRKEMLATLKPRYALLNELFETSPVLWTHFRDTWMIGERRRLGETPTEFFKKATLKDYASMLPRWTNPALSKEMQQIVAHFLDADNNAAAFAPVLVDYVGRHSTRSRAPEPHDFLRQLRRWVQSESRTAPVDDRLKWKTDSQYNPLAALTAPDQRHKWDAFVRDFVYTEITGRKTALGHSLPLTKATATQHDWILKLWYQQRIKEALDSETEFMAEWKWHDIFDDHIGNTLRTLFVDRGLDRSFGGIVVPPEVAGRGARWVLPTVVEQRAQSSIAAPTSSKLQALKAANGRQITQLQQVRPWDAEHARQLVDIWKGRTVTSDSTKIVIDVFTHGINHLQRQLTEEILPVTEKISRLLETVPDIRSEFITKIAKPLTEGLK